MENGLKIHQALIMSLMNQMKHQLSSKKFVFQTGIKEISRYEVITLHETFRGPFVLLFIGLLLSLLSLTIELIKLKYKNEKKFRPTRNTIASRVAW